MQKILFCDKCFHEILSYVCVNNWGRKYSYIYTEYLSSPENPDKHWFLATNPDKVPIFEENENCWSFFYENEFNFVLIFGCRFESMLGVHPHFIPSNKVTKKFLIKSWFSFPFFDKQNFILIINCPWAYYKCQTKH